MCFQVRFDSKNRTYKRLSISYQSFVLVYTFVIMILSIFMWNQYKELTIEYKDRISNWKIDPIYEIYKKEICDSDSENFFILQNGATIYNQWINQNQTFILCLRRLKDYNFVQKYQIYPTCLDTEQLCGGVYVQNKYCAPVGQCPINSIKFVTSDELKTIDTTKYSINVQINNNFYLIASTLAEYLPISQIEIFGSTPCVSSQFTNYQTIFSQAYCENDTSYTLLNQIDEMTYATANGFTSNTADKVGVYSRNYIQQSIECRQRSLITWGQRTIVDDNSLYAVLSILMVSSAINFGITGFVQTLYYFFQVQYQAVINKNVDKTLLIIKILSSYFNAIMIVLAFSLEMDIKLYLELSSNLKCSDKQTLNIIKNQLNSMNDEWRYSFIIFILFVAFVLFEFVAFSICIDKKLKRKIEPKFRQITFSTSNVSLISNKTDNQNLYLYFKPQLFVEQNNDFNLQQALDIKQFDQSEFPDQVNQDISQKDNQSVSPKLSNSIERSPQQSYQNSLKQQQNIEQQQQQQQQQPYMAQNQKTIFNQTDSIQQDLNDLNNFQSQQIPIQKPSVKYDIDDQIEDEDIDDKKHKINK